MKLKLALLESVQFPKSQQSLRAAAGFEIGDP
jgi:hypothetical protein